VVARLWALAALALGLAGCSTMGTLHGARPLEPGEHMMQAALSLQKQSNPITTALDLPLPQVELGYRRGLAPDLDWGARIYLLGTVADLRYRFARLGSFDIATQPSLGLFVLPTPATGFGNLDLGLPIVAETDLGAKGRSSLVLSARTVGRQHFAWLSDETLGSGAAGRFELLAGGGVRLSRTFNRLRLGGYADLLVNTSRLGPVWWTGGADLALVLGQPREEPGGAD
jgi:uncharacterized protein YceK